MPIRLIYISLLIVELAVAEVLAQPLHNPTDALTFLQQRHELTKNVFVEQNELDALIAKGGGGACPSAAAVDVLQALRAMTGEDLLSNPHKVVLASYANEPQLLNGRVSNENLQRLIEFYDDEYLLSADLDLVVRSSPGYSAYDRKWSRSEGPILSTKDGQIKLLSYTVSTANGEELGRHFVLLKNREGGRLTVVDPARPTKNYEYDLIFKSEDGKEYTSIYLIRPYSGNYEGRVHELNTVFTVSVGTDRTSTVAQVPDQVSAERIKTKFDEIARKLRGSEKPFAKKFISPTLWREKTATFGLPGLDMPKEYGGAGWNALQILEIFRHAGTHNLNFRDVVGGAHGRLLLNSKSSKVEAVIRDVVAGKAYIAVAMTEPTAGSDYHAIKSYAKKTDGGYLLTGEKRYVARLRQATHVVLFAKGTSGRQRELSAFLVPLAKDGPEVIDLEPHGLTGNSFGGLKFKDLFVPDDCLIGEDGKGNDIFVNHFRYWRLMQAASAIGTGEGALTQMANRLKTREAFGGPIGRFTHLQQPLGQYSTELSMAFALAREAAALLDAGGEGNLKKADLLINGLKAEGVEIAIKSVDAATRSFGAEGYSNQVDLGDRLRDLNGLRIADGTTDVMRMSVVTQKFGREFWSMGVRRTDVQLPSP